MDSRPLATAVIAVVVVAVLFFASSAAVSTLSDDTQRLVVTDEDGTVLIDEPVEDGDEVRLEYTHSVEKTPVSDIYTVNGTALESTRMEFESYGAGLPSNADVERTGDGRFVTYTEGTHERIVVSPGAIAGHTLTVNDTTYDLVALADGSVSITVTDR
ncbi:DUF1850 domain-containing protein [Halalkalicoccus sp. NIPERK01]|uniref:DUF1850 domain-containing protein n=1 Tax=Halalkalicoccus sp. NIPERK01 TaxID=3053469 RepID=UPI00256F5689|nr:DUF1850 domain-containing protein [Halalkalicoccus sp. NIPERK01]MDL5360701.1 DUF1850 domain-containing protein [Halalkalicoccus sp. NIPERK01]